MYLSRNNSIPFFTESVKRFTLLNVFLFLLILLALNIFLVFTIQMVLFQELDKRLTHESENIKAAIVLTIDSVQIVDYREFNEPDLSELTDHPYFLQIYNSDGLVLLTSENIKLYDSIPVILKTNLSVPEFEDLKQPKNNLRTGYFPLYDKHNDQVATMQLSVFADEYDTVLSQVVQFNLILLPLIVLFIIILSVYAAKRTFAPLNKIILTANKISALNISERLFVKASSTDEIGRLRDTLNSLFDRISAYIVELKQFSDNASHQLLNPLTALKSDLEYLLKKERSVDEYKVSLNELHNQTSNMISLVNTLLLLARSDKSTVSVQSVVNLSSILLKDVRKTFNQPNIKFQIEESIYVKGSIDKFLIVFNNLISNSLKYSSPESPIILKLSTDKKNIVFTIVDEGIGIPADDYDKVFDRFYRASNVENLGIKGFGLGLSLVKSIIQEFSGQVHVVPTAKGTKILFTLPYLNLT